MILPDLPLNFLTPLLVLIPLVAVAGWIDFSRLVIPNRLVLLTCVAILTTFGAAPLPFEEAAMRVLIALLSFAVCCGMFAAGLLGGGDAKFFPVVLLAIPVAWIGPFLMLYGLSLGITFAILCAGRLTLGSPNAEILSLRPEPEVPLGVPMALSSFFLVALAVAA